MKDYVFRVPSPNLAECHRTSTAGDSSTPRDQWLWPPGAILNSPSSKLGMGLAEEMHLRARAVNWVVRICITLQLPQLIIATAAAYVHRFYMRKPLQRYPPKVMSATALFLATKVEEVPRKLEYVVREYLKVDDQGQEQPTALPEDSCQFQTLKQQILYYEDILLRALCFDLAIDHPYLPLVNHVKAIHESHSCSRNPRSSTSVELADRAKAKSITQAAWGFVNDSLTTPLCLVATPESIAAAALLLAVTHRLSESPPTTDEPPPSQEIDVVGLHQYLNTPPNEHSSPDHTPEPWWQLFKVDSVEEIYRVANAMLDQYELSVCDYIRERASRLARFPGPSLLCPPVQLAVQNAKTRSSSAQTHSDVAPSTPNINDHHKLASEQDKRSSHQNGNSSNTPTPRAPREEELPPQGVERGCEERPSDVPVSNIPEGNQSPPRGAGQLDTTTAPAVTLPRQEHEVSSSRGRETTSQVDGDVKPPTTTTGGGGQEEEEAKRPSHATSHRGNSNPVRRAMSDSMDLGTSVDSDGSSPRRPASPSGLKLRPPLPPPPDTPLLTSPAVRKRSRGAGESPPAHDQDDARRVKTPKLERTPMAPYPPQQLDASPHDRSTVPELPVRDPRSPTPTDHRARPHVATVSPPRTDAPAVRSESSLSDMEDDE